MLSRTMAGTQNGNETPLRRRVVFTFALLLAWFGSVSIVLDRHRALVITLGLFFFLLAQAESGFVLRRFGLTSESLITRWIRTTACIIPLLLLWGLYYIATDAWWMNDDVAILNSIIDRGIFSHFYQPSVWRQFSSSLLTPWCQLTFGLDLHLFGLTPAGFYYHQLVVFSLVILLAYLVLRIFFTPLICSFILCMFVASAPSATVAQFLMVRHYLEGLGFSCAAILLYVKSVCDNSRRYSIIGSIFYLLACTTKEIYVPLVLLLPFLPVSTLSKRLRVLPAFLVVVVAYVAWRAYMLGAHQLFSGYGDIYGPVQWGPLASLPLRFVGIVGWRSKWQWVLLALIVGPCLFRLRDSWSRRALFCALIVLSLFPIIPVIPILSERYLFVPVFLSCVALGAGLDVWLNLKGRSMALQTAGFFLALTLIALNVTSVESSLRANRELVDYSRTTGKFVLYEGSNADVLMNPRASPWLYRSLRHLRLTALGLPEGPRVCYDICACNLDGAKRAYQYNQSHFEEMNPSALTHEKACGDSQARLSIDMHFSSEKASWQFGPYTRGQYYLSTALVQEPMDGFFLALPHEGSAPFRFSAPLQLVLKYRSPDGWVTYSPAAKVPSQRSSENDSANLHWER